MIISSDSSLWIRKSRALTKWRLLPHLFDGENGRSGDTADGREDPEERGRGVEKEVKKGSWGGRVDTKGQGGGKKRSERKQTEAFEQN